MGRRVSTAEVFNSSTRRWRQRQQNSANNRLEWPRHTCRHATPASVHVQPQSNTGSSSHLLLICSIIDWLHQEHMAGKAAGRPKRGRVRKQAGSSRAQDAGIEWICRRWVGLLVWQAERAAQQRSCPGPMSTSTSVSFIISSNNTSGRCSPEVQPNLAGAVHEQHPHVRRVPEPAGLGGWGSACNQAEQVEMGAGMGVQWPCCPATKSAPDSSTPQSSVHQVQATSCVSAACLAFHRSKLSKAPSLPTKPSPPCTACCVLTHRLSASCLACDNMPRLSTAGRTPWRRKYSSSSCMWLQNWGAGEEGRGHRLPSSTG